MKVKNSPLLHVYVIEDFLYADKPEYRADVICDELNIVGTWEDDYFKPRTMAVYGYGPSPERAIEDVKEQLIEMGVHGTLRRHH